MKEIPPEIGNLTKLKSLYAKNRILNFLKQNIYNFYLYNI